MRKGLAIAAVGLLAALGALHGAEAQGAKRSPCDRSRTTTIKKQAGSRVFTQRRGSLRTTYACRYKTGRVFKLNTEYLDDLQSGGVELIRLAGVYVGWAHPYSDEFNDYEDVRVMDLRNGSKVSPDTSETAGEDFDVTDTALTPKGSFAWIVVVTSGESLSGESSVFEVYTLIDRKVTKVDSGKRIRGNSLLLEGSTLSWINRGERKETTLP